MRKLPLKAEKVLSRLEWTALRRLDGLVQGDYRSLFRGFGLDFAGLREYRFHDEVRRIDWNATARFGEPYVRLYEEDREITAWFLLDLSPSVDFGSATVRKRGLLVDFVAMLSRILTRHGNRVGAVLFGGGRETILAPRSGRDQVLRLLTTLLAQPELDRAAPTDLAALFALARGLIPRRSLVFAVSDFFSASPWALPLGRLARRHEVVGIRLVDPLERSLPDLGYVLLRDAESGENLLADTHDRGFRKRFAEAAGRREDELRSNFAAAGTDVLELSTADDPVAGILSFMEARRLRTASRSKKGA